MPESEHLVIQQYDYSECEKTGLMLTIGNELIKFTIVRYGTAELL